MRRPLVLAGVFLLVSCAAPADPESGTGSPPEENPGALSPEPDGPDEKRDNEVKYVARAAGDGECSPGISPDELAATPREHRSLERLAMLLDGTAVADPARYERILADVEAMRQVHPAGVYEFRPWTEGISLQLTPEAYAAAQAGAYSEWDCLNEAYGAYDFGFLDFESDDAKFAFFEIPGALDLAIVAADYERLEGVTLAAPGGRILGLGRALCAVDTGEGILYQAREEWGDCPAGCIYERVHGFLSTSPGVVEPLGVWDSSAATEAMPGWAEVPEGC